MSDIMSSENVKIRKPHKCWGCGETYPVGTKMDRVISKDGGEFSTAYWCPICIDIINEHDYNDDEFAFGEIKHEMREEWEDVRKQFGELKEVK